MSVTEALLEVLVVEDEDILREQVAQLLPLLGYRVRAAADAASAFVELDRALPDIILTDLMLPDQPGYSVLEQSQQRQPGLPVLVMTAYASLESAIEALKQGAYDYLLKPILPAELSAALSRAAVAVALQRSRERAEHLRHIAEVALTLAHEINNPLAILMGELQIQLETPDGDPDMRRRLEIALESAHRIADVVRQIAALHEISYQEYYGLRLLNLHADAS
jgi:two-component system sensor histidine kinase HydH